MLNPQSFDYSGNVIFESITGSYGWDETTFRFSDNNFEFVEETIINNSSSDDELPIVNSTLRNYPNPFNPSTTIIFSLTTEITEDMELVIYNLKGQKIKSFPVHQFTNSHVYQITWDGKDENDKLVSSGIYFYQLNIDGKIEALRKMLLMK